MYEESVENLVILKSMARNFPVLQAWGYGINRLILLVVDGGQMKAVIDFLSDMQIPRIGDHMPFRRIAEIVQVANSTCVAVPFSSTSKGQEIIKSLATATKIGELEGQIFTALPIVVADSLPMAYDVQDLFVVHIPGDLIEVKVPEDLVVPEDDKLAVVEDKIHEIASGYERQEERALLAAVCFLYPGLVKKGLKSEFEQYVEKARRLFQLDDEAGDNEDLEILFIRCLYEWQIKTGFYMMYELPNLESRIIGDFGKIILFDEAYVYMKEPIFRDIAQPLLETKSSVILKRELAKQEILCPSENSTYTAKMGYFNVVGEYRRERMLRLNRKKLIRTGDLEFVEMCIGMEGDKHD